MDDGRHIDPAMGILQGEGAQQETPQDRSRGEGTAPFEVWPIPAEERGRQPSYYDRPVLKKPVWKWYVPAYFYCGGLSGAAATLGAAAHLADADAHVTLVARARWVSAVAAAAGTGPPLLGFG